MPGKGKKSLAAIAALTAIGISGVVFKSENVADPLPYTRLEEFTNSRIVEHGVNSDYEIEYTAVRLSGSGLPMKNKLINKGNPQEQVKHNRREFVAVHGVINSPVRILNASDAELKRARPERIR